MSFADAVRSVLSQYAGFTGRARRSEYWWWFLAVLVIDIVAEVIDKAAGTYPVIYIVVNLALFLPNLAVGIRRLHDTGRSGWWILIGLIPIVGWIILIVFYCGDSGPDNQYGPNPKGAGGQPGAPSDFPPPPTYNG